MEHPEIAKKLFSLLDTTTDIDGLNTLEKLLFEKVLDGSLQDEHYTTLHAALTDKRTSLTRESAPVTPVQGGLGKCAKCGLGLTHMQVMWGETICVECQRRTRGI